MTPEQRQGALDRLSDMIVKDFQQDFNDVLGEAYAVTGRTPEQANNEIRNTLIHCARVFAATDVVEADFNIAQAKWHVDLARRDCFKICILAVREDITRVLDIYEYRHQTIRNSDRQRLKGVLGQMKGLLKKEKVAETRHDPTITRDFETLYDDITEFEEHVRTTYPVTRTASNVARRMWMRTVKTANTIGFWIVAALLIAILASPIMPEPVKNYYHQTMKILFCKISTSAMCSDKLPVAALRSEVTLGLALQAI
jgi:hypothetical protein